MTSDPLAVEVLQRNHYYAFGMEQEGAWTAATTPRMDYTYNGKEFQEELGLNWLAYGFRMYDPAIGRFPSVDPIAAEFAWASPFNYAENRVPNGIDLWGLQFLNADESKIYLDASGARLKFENLSMWTQGRILNATTFTYYTEHGAPQLSRTFSTRVGNLNFEELSLKRVLPSDNSVVTRMAPLSRPGGGNAKQRRKWRRQMEREGLSPGKNNFVVPNGNGRAIPIIWGVAEGLKMIINTSIKADLSKALDQFAQYGENVYSIIEKGIEDGIIPINLQEPSMLGDIGNYLLQGEFVNTYEESTFNQMLDASQTLMLQNNIPINCTECQQDQEP